MNPLPVAIAAVVVVVVPPLRRRIVPVSDAIAVGVGSTAVSAFVGIRNTVEAIVKGTTSTTDERS